MSQHNVLSLTANRFSGICTQDLSTTEAETVIALALNVLKKQHQPGQVLSSPDDTKAYLRIQLRDHKAEVFGALLLSNRHHVIANEILFQGTIDGASVHPRVVVQRALEVNAAALIVYHTHPSQVVEPSSADQAITRRLKDALALVDIRLLDHFVVCASDSVSFAERGLL